MASSQSGELMISALHMALNDRRPVKLIHHSDHGSQYTSKAFHKVYEAHNARLSMGCVAYCYENEMAESFFVTLECELVDRQPSDGVAMRGEARKATFRHIEGFYNQRRRHPALDYQSPVDFETDELGMEAG